MRLPAIVALCLLAASGCGRSGPVGAADEPAGEQVPTPIGLWDVPKAQLEEVNAQAEAAGKRVLYLPPDPFFFHGDSATMHLITLKAWMWRSEDDDYRVKTQWV